MATLRTSEINTGGTNNIVAHCPNCSKMYPTTDEQGRGAGFPPQCQRCGCPMDNEKNAETWMNMQAEGAHDSNLAKIGAVTRAMTSPPAHVSLADSANK